ncbi:hypothetical protein NDU88_005753 [Pleurodeles waltl]|uniref:Uncharacterized protein n=1 Tax=Pleurodeles waltl TaxID=8319 RepID=A0AAV7RMZ3_PLEWA|nr:hypothetical protein NDU88_005753 [Pleurodeles waltl]
MAEQGGRQRVQDQWESAKIKAQRRREWQSKAEDRRWRDRTENSGTAQKAKAQALGRHLPATLDTREDEGGFELAIGRVGGDGERRRSKVELSAQGSELRPKATLDTREEEGGFELAIGRVGGDGERRRSKVELSAQGSELRPKDRAQETYVMRFMNESYPLPHSPSDIIRV